MLASDFTRGDVLTFRCSAMKMSSSGTKAIRLAFPMVFRKLLGIRGWFPYLINLDIKLRAMGAMAANSGKIHRVNFAPRVLFYASPILSFWPRYSAYGRAV